MEMPLLTISEEELHILRELIEGALRQKVEDLRLGELERHGSDIDQRDLRRAEAFFQGALALIRSDLVGLYRIVLAEEPKRPLEEPVEETVQQEY